MIEAKKYSRAQYILFVVDDPTVALAQILTGVGVPFAQTDPKNIVIPPYLRKFTGKGEIFDLITTRTQGNKIVSELAVVGIKEYCHFRVYSMPPQLLRSLPNNFHDNPGKKLSDSFHDTLGATIYSRRKDTPMSHTMSQS